MIAPRPPDARRRDASGCRGVDAYASTLTTLGLSMMPAPASKTDEMGSDSKSVETSGSSAVGTRNAMPVSLPLSEGMTLVTALAAPVDDGMMLPDAHRPPRQSLFDDASTTFCVAVMACTVVMSAISMPKLSLMTFTVGARPLVVHDAHETAFHAGSYSPSLTPITTVGESSLAGAEKTIFL